MGSAPHTTFPLPGTSAARNRTEPQYRRASGRVRWLYSMLIVVLAKLFLSSVSLPQLRTFYGSNLTVSSSHSDLNWTDLDAYAHSNLEIIRGAYTCTAVAPSTTGTSVGGTSPDTSPTPDSTDLGGLAIGSKAGIAVGVVLAPALLLALGWFLLERRKKACKGAQTVLSEYIPELPQGDYYGKVEPSITGPLVEADSETPVKEISSGRTDKDPREPESRPLDDTRHSHHCHVYEGPTPVDDTRISRFTDYEGPTPVDDTRHSHHADVYEMPS